MLIHLHCLFLFTLALSHEGKAQSLYPDLTCHPAYWNPNDGTDNGEGWIRFVMNICNTTELLLRTGCYKKCIFLHHDILDTFVDPDSKLDKMAYDVHMFTKVYTDEATRSRIADRITACDGALKAVVDAGVHCEEWHEFYNCVETAWDCQPPESMKIGKQNGWDVDIYTPTAELEREHGFYYNIYKSPRVPSFH